LTISLFAVYGRETEIQALLPRIGLVHKMLHQMSYVKPVVIKSTSHTNYQSKRNEPDWASNPGSMIVLWCSAVPTQLSGHMNPALLSKRQVSLLTNTYCRKVRFPFRFLGIAGGLCCSLHLVLLRSA
jgi:hypothetical protein